MTQLPTSSCPYKSFPIPFLHAIDQSQHSISNYKSIPFTHPLHDSNVLSSLVCKFFYVLGSSRLPYIQLAPLQLIYLSVNHCLHLGVSLFYFNLLVHLFGYSLTVLFNNYLLDLQPNYRFKQLKEQWCLRQSGVSGAVTRTSISSQTIHRLSVKMFPIKMTFW